MLRRFLKPSEMKEYNLIFERSYGGKYFVSGIGEKDRRTISSYIDGLMSYSELIPSNEDRVLVSLKETDETLFCEVKTLSNN